MAKRSTDDRNSEWIVSTDDVDDLGESFTIQSHKTIRLVLLRDTRLTIVGKSTGKTYVFNGAGSQLDVDEEDAVVMLEKTSGVKSCCDSPPSKYFDVVR
jgi:hypothetical protein